MAILRAWVLAAPGAPPGVDGGNWLAFGRTLLGEHVRPASIVYPPAVPLLVTGAVNAFGATVGVATVAAISALGPAVGAFLALRWAGLGWWAAVLAGFLLPASALGEVAAWGGYPQLLSAPLMVSALWMLDRWLRSGDRRALVGAALLGGLVLSVSHFTALVGALAAAAVTTCHLCSGPGGRWSGVARKAVIALALTAAVALPLAPTYLRLVPAVLGSRGAAPSLATIGLSQVPGRFVEIHGALWFLWALGAGGAALGLVVFWGLRRHPLWVLNAALGTGLLGAFLLTGEPRILHELPLLAVTGAGLWLIGLGRSGRHPIEAREHRVATAAVAIGLLLVTVVGARDLPRHRDRYAVLDPDLMRAVEWIRDNTPTDAVVAASAVGDVPLGWWIEGLAGRRAVYGAPLRWLIFPEERRRAALANRLFLIVGMPSKEGMRVADSMEVRYVLLAKALPAFDASRLITYEATRSPSFENGSAVIVEVGANEGAPVGHDGHSAWGVR